MALLNKDNLLGAGALIGAMVSRGLVVKVSDGKYALPHPNAPVQAPAPALKITQLPIQIEERAAPVPAANSRTVIETEPVFLEVGAYVFPSTVLIERDDRGGAVVTLPVSETDARTGKSLPREIQLTPEEWATRRRITLIDVIEGSAPANLFDRISELEREVLRLRKDYDAAWTLAQDYEAQINEYRQWDWAIKIAQQGKAA
jgi:hypothetical protein